MNISDTVPALLLVAPIAPWQAAVYAAHRAPLTLTAVARFLARLESHRRALEARGDVIAAAGVATPLRQSVLEVAAVAATSPRALARKVALLRAHRWCWVDQPMTALMIEAAIVSDIAALQLGAQRRARVLQQLRGGR